MAFYVPIGWVRFARYCGKMYIRHLFGKTCSLQGEEPCFQFQICNPIDRLTILCVGARRQQSGNGNFVQMKQVGTKKLKSICYRKLPLIWSAHNHFHKFNWLNRKLWSNRKCPWSPGTQSGKCKSSVDFNAVCFAFIGVGLKEHALSFNNNQYRFLCQQVNIIGDLC